MPVIRYQSVGIIVWVISDLPKPEVRLLPNVIGRGQQKRGDQFGRDKVKIKHRRLRIFEHDFVANYLCELPSRKGFVEPTTGAVAGHQLKQAVRIADDFY